MQVLRHEGIERRVQFRRKCGIRGQSCRVEQRDMRWRKKGGCIEIVLVEVTSQHDIADAELIA